jgi:hypothetical protein
MANIRRTRPTRKIKGKFRGKAKNPYRRKRTTRRTNARREPGTVEIQDGKITLLLPGKLKSLNTLKNGLARYGDTKTWEARIRAAKLVKDDESVRLPLTSRARLEISRLHPNKSCILDFVNLEGGTKGLEDALKRCGYIVDDNYKWLDRVPSKQLQSFDKQYWAVAVVTVLED